MPKATGICIMQASEVSGCSSCSPPCLSVSCLHGGYCLHASVHSAGVPTHGRLYLDTDGRVPTTDGEKKEEGAPARLTRKLLQLSRPEAVTAIETLQFIIKKCLSFYALYFFKFSCQLGGHFPGQPGLAHAWLRA